MRLSKERIKREKGYLYFIDKAGDISRVKMKRSGKKYKAKREKVLKVGIKKKPGMLYYVDKMGYVAAKPIKRR